MRHLLVSAAVAAVLLTAAFAVVRVVGDPAVRTCAAASSAVDAANDAHQDAMGKLERWWRRGGTEADTAGRGVQQAKAELDAARAAFVLACHYETDGPRAAQVE
jgi:hypothetical protein